MANTQQTL